MENVLLIGSHLKNSGSSMSSSRESLEELERLVETAGGQVVGKVLQSMDRPSPATLIGKGKVEELRTRALGKEFKTIIFDEELKPAQQKNLSEAIPAKVLDRTRLILDIFAKRARSREGILQVELAQLSYMLPRMTERYGRFEQQVGGIGTRGPGERKLEVEARHVRDRMSALKKQIESVKLHRELARERRRNVPLPVIAIVGYTNAGKSSLLNRLVQTAGEPTEPIYADDKLFATLDPTTRRIRLPSGRWALFTDTVGFINKLPTNLIAAFHSTLEETLDADLLIHLVDSTERSMMEHSEVVLDILKSLDPGGTSLKEKMIVAYNKSDLLPPEDRPRAYQNQQYLFGGKDQAPEPIFVSATQGTGIARILDAVETKLSERMTKTEVYVPFAKSSLLGALYRLGKVEEIKHEKKGVRLQLRLEKSHLNKLNKILSREKLK